MAFLNEKTLSIPNINIPDIQANIYVAADGTANYDVLALPTDTTTEDTAADAGDAVTRLIVWDNAVLDLDEWLS